MAATRVLSLSHECGIGTGCNVGTGVALAQDAALAQYVASAQVWHWHRCGVGMAAIRVLSLSHSSKYVLAGRYTRPVRGSKSARWARGSSAVSGALLALESTSIAVSCNG